MAMTVRFGGDAELCHGAESRSMQEVVPSAVRDEVASRDVPRRVRRSIETTLPAYRDLFTRLGQA